VNLHRRRDYATIRRLDQEEASMWAAILLVQATITFPPEIRAKVLPFYEQSIAASDKWTECLFDTADAYNKQDIPVTQAIDAAYGACKALELVYEMRTRRMFQVLGDTGGKAREVIGEFRTTSRQILLSQLTNDRIIRGRSIN
jgi:hypothetical protein